MLDRASHVLALLDRAKPIHKRGIPRRLLVKSHSTKGSVLAPTHVAKSFRNKSNNDIVVTSSMMPFVNDDVVVSFGRVGMSETDKGGIAGESVLAGISSVFVGGVVAFFFG